MNEVLYYTYIISHALSLLIFILFATLYLIDSTKYNLYLSLLYLIFITTYLICNIFLIIKWVYSSYEIFNKVILILATVTKIISLYLVFLPNINNIILNIILLISFSSSIVVHIILFSMQKSNRIKILYITYIIIELVFLNLFSSNNNNNNNNNLRSDNKSADYKIILGILILILDFFNIDIKLFSC